MCECIDEIINGENKEVLSWEDILLSYWISGHQLIYTSV